MIEREARKGDWVQIERVVLEPGDRAPQVPEDTQRVPLVMRVKGFAQEAAELGELLTVRTVVGRQVQGELVEINPRYEHDFGGPIPELLAAGLGARRMLEGED